MQPRTRRVQRIRFPQPLFGRLDRTAVSVVDLSVLGARVEHNAALATGSHGRLSFEWEGESISGQCRIVRSRMERTAGGARGVYHSGIEFDNLPAETRETLRRLIELSVRAQLDEQRQAAGAAVPAVRFSGAWDASADGYFCFSLESNAWVRKRTHDPGQPAEGFTISAAEDDAQVDLLCEAYEKSDREGRRLIQLFAQLSIIEGERATTPPDG